VCGFIGIVLQTLTLSLHIFTRKVKYQNRGFSCRNTSKMSDYMKKCLETTEDMMRLSSSILLNEKQCNNLVANFRKGVEAIQKVNKGSRRNVFSEVEQDLLRIVNKAKKMVDECCKDDWCHGAVWQINNKETFRELLLDLECCFHTMCDMSRMCCRGQSQKILQTRNWTTFYPTSIDEVEKDQNALHKRLLEHLKIDTIKDRALAQYLLRRMTGLQLAQGEELDNIVFPYDYPHSKPSGRLDIPLGETCTKGCVVLPTKWVDIESATKVMEVANLEHKRVLWKEASILGGLNHPNIIKFFCCGFFHEEIEKFELVMERGKLDLCKLLIEKKASITKFIRMDIMLQIASGMCYLHDMKVAHRDLKPNNVVVTSMDVSKSDGRLEYVHVKLVDFGISKIEVKESPQVPTGEFPYGTIRYMAPEAFENRSLEVNAFKTDVFSFAMTSFEILSGEKPFGEISPNDYWKFIRDGKRPNLPENCSKELKSLIHDCWSLDPSKRPTFLDICNTLRLLKSAMFKNVISMDEILQPKEPSWSYDLLMNPKQWLTDFMRILYSALCQIVLLWQIFVALSLWLRFMPTIGEYGSSPQDTRNDPSLHEILDKVIGLLIFFCLLSHIVANRISILKEINDIESLG
jgi:serine/threonine protein kinase